jgi:hypothetical protein
MPEQAHFKYEAHIQLKSKEMAEESTNKNEFRVTDVKFFVPASISYEINGRSHTIKGGIDYARKEIYLDDEILDVSKEEIKNKVFGFLNIVTHLPENSFSAPESVYEDVDKIQEEVNGACDNIFE